MSSEAIVQVPRLDELWTTDDLPLRAPVIDEVIVVDPQGPFEKKPLAIQVTPEYVRVTRMPAKKGAEVPLMQVRSNRYNRQVFSQPIGSLVVARTENEQQWQVDAGILLDGEVAPFGHFISVLASCASIKQAKLRWPQFYRSELALQHNRRLLRKR